MASTRLTAVFIVSLFLANPCVRVPAAEVSPPAGESAVSQVNGIWAAFSGRLGRGEYPSAYTMFSEDSRVVFPYADFLKEYGPMSRAREILLAEPVSLTASVLGDWAELVFTIVTPVSMEELRVNVGMAKRRDGWELVAGRNEEKERVEAAVRNILRHLQAQLPDFTDAGSLSGALQKPPLAGHVAFKLYRFGIRDGIIEASPSRKGFRTYRIAPTGSVRENGEADRPAERPPAAVPAPVPEEPEPPPPIRTNGFMPELAEPPPAGGAVAASGPGDPPELAEPPPIPGFDAGRPGAASSPANRLLPERIR